MDFRGMRKGANAPVSGNECTVVVGSSGVDVLTFQLGADDRVRSDADVVFYNQPASPEGAVRLTGPGAVTVYLDLVPESVATVAIAVAAADETVTSPLSRGLDVTLTTGVDGFRWAPAGLRTERAAILAELYRRNGTWKLRNVSAGWEQGLPALFTHFGVAVDDGADAAVPVPSSPSPIPAPAAAVFAGAAAAPSPPVSPAARPASPVAPVKKRAVKSRVAWAVTVFVALLVLAGILGRKSDSTQNTAQPVLAAAPVVTASPSATEPTTSPSPAPSSRPPSSSAPPSSTAQTSTSAPFTARAQPPLAAPAAVPPVRTKSAAQSAVVVLDKLRVAGRAPKTGYSRAQFGQAWTDDVAVDSGHNGCDTRNDVLRRDLRQVVLRAGSNGCAVTTGTLVDPYTGRTLAFTSSRAATVQIDHVVALSNAWQTGAAALSPQQRQDLANDPLNLQATEGAVNQAKGDGDAATWLPPDKSYRCSYVARQVAVKARYGLWVTAAERKRISDVLTGCGATPATPIAVPAPTRATAPTRAPSTAAAIVPPPRTTIRATPTSAAAPTTVQEPPVPTTTTEPTTSDITTTETTTEAPTTEESTAEEPTTEESTAGADADVYYKNCTAAWEAGAAPLMRGQPGYRDKLDGDGDGVACEKPPR